MDTASPSAISLRRGWPLLVLFFGIIVGVGLIVGAVSAPGEWYQNLAKPEALILPPWFSFPLWLFLCVAFAVAGWRLWQIDSSAPEARLWLAILILSWWFSPVFFLVRSPLAAFLIIAALSVLMILFIARTWSSDRVSALLFLPCLAWVVYATGMTGAIVVMNWSNPQLA